MRLVFIILSFLIVAFSSIASENDSITNRIFENIYNQQYETANDLLQSNKANIDYFYFSVLEIDLNYWRYITGTDQRDYDKFEKILLKYKPNKTEAFNQKVTQLITLSYQLRYELKRFKLLDALSTRRKTKTIFNELKIAKQTLPADQQELFQLYNSLFIYFDNYLNPFVLKTKRHNCQQAILSMEKLIHSEKKIVKTLTTYFLAKVYLKYEKEQKNAARCFKILAESYPGNKKFRELLAVCVKEE